MRTKHVLIIGSGLLLGTVIVWIFWLVGGRESERARPEPATAPVQAAALSELPAQPVPEPEGTNAAASTNKPASWMDAEPKRLTAEQAEAYVRENHRNAISLLAASRTSGEKGYLREAMQKFPNDPRVAFDAYFFAEPHDSKQPATPERRQWLENLKQADPNNPLPNYLAARDDFRAGKTEVALQELQAASGKPAFNDYLLESLQMTEEAYRSAGFSEGDAKSTASWSLLLPHLSETKQLAEDMAELAAQYQKSGDAASASRIMEMGLSLGQQVGGPAEFPLINTLVGIAIQKKLLSVMEPSAPYLDTGTTIQEQINALNQYRESLKGLAPQEEMILPRLSEADRVSFYDRLRMFGESAAVKWAAEKYGAQ